MVEVIINEKFLDFRCVAFEIHFRVRASAQFGVAFGAVAFYLLILII